MFVTTSEVLELTGYTVSAADIKRAQYIIESYVGREESAVEDPNDKALLGRATGYQAAYMNKNGDMVFEQIGAKYLGQNNSVVTFEDDSPFVAPLAKIACRKLSWRGSRSVKTGNIFNSGAAPSWETV